MSRILLHICCAPCSTHCIEALRAEGEVTGIFINPNVQPEEEYIRRLEEARRISELAGIRLIEVPYDPESWNEAIIGLEDEPEGGRRCEVCFRVRLERVAQIAAREGFDSFTTTLTISPHKNAALIHAAGKKAAEAHGIAFREDNFKKKEGFKHSIELSKKFGLYRQDYCGCPMSRKRVMGKPGS